MPLVYLAHYPRRGAGVVGVVSQGGGEMGNAHACAKKQRLSRTGYLALALDVRLKLVGSRTSEAPGTDAVWGPYKGSVHDTPQPNSDPAVGLGSDLT